MALDTSNAWYTERDKIAIVGASGTNSQSYSDPASGKSVKIHITKYDEEFSDAESKPSGDIYSIAASGDPSNLNTILSNGTESTGSNLIAHELLEGDIVKISGTPSPYTYDGYWKVKIITGNTHQFYLRNSPNTTISGTFIGTWKKVTKLTLGESPNIPSQFHRALAYWVIAHGYEIQGSQEEDASVLQLAGYWGQKFEKDIIEAKKYSNKKRNDSGYSIIPQDY